MCRGPAAVPPAQQRVSDQRCHKGGGDQDGEHRLEGTAIGLGQHGPPEAGQQPKPVRYPEDDFVVAVATDAQAQLPVPTQLPLLDLNQPAQVVNWLLEYAHRFEYNWELHGGLLPSA